MRDRGNIWSIGERLSVGTSATGVDVWSGTATTVPIPDQTNGEQMTVVSSSASDTAAGTGVRQIKIHYLDSDWLEQTETVTLNGLTPVNTVATDIKFVNDMHSVAVGSGGAAAGNIDLYRTGDATRVYDRIIIATNMSLTISKMIPADRNFYLSRWAASATGTNKLLRIRLRSTDHDCNLYSGVFIFKDVVTLEAGGSYVRRWDMENRICIPAKSIIKVTAWADSAGATVATSYEGETVTLT